MTTESLTAPPREFRAGDSAEWRRTLAAYPAGAGWQIKYTLLGAGGAYSVESAADGDTHVVSLAPSDTGSWVEGVYVLTEYVTDGAARYTLASRSVRILPDLAGATSAADTRTHARKVLDAIEGWLEKQAPVYGKYEFNGRKLETFQLTDLLALRDRYRAEVSREEMGGGARMLVNL